MRTTCRLILGIAVFVAAAGVASAQQPDPQLPPSPVPETQVTPAPPAPDIVPPTEQTSKTLVLVPIPTAPALATTVKPVKKAPASKKPIEKPATPESSSQAKEAAAAASVTVTADSSSPPPPGAPGTANDSVGIASPDLSPKAPPAVDPVVQAEMDKKSADAAQRKKTVGGRILLGVGGLALIGLAVFFVRSRSGMNTLPPIFDGASVATVATVATVAAVRSRPAR
jgi:hypothetical protein